MSLLNIAESELKGGKGAALPPRAYRFTVLQAQIEQKENGKMYSARLGNLRTKEGAGEFEYQGANYRIGNRIVFARHWIEHNNPDAAKAGNGQIIKLAIALGIVPVPEKGTVAELDFNSWEDFAEATVGREGIVVTKQRTRTDASGEQVTDADVSTYLAP